MRERLDLGPMDGDAELLRKAKQGDALAFERFLRVHDAGVRAMTTRILNGRWVEDVLQETYLKAYRALPDLRAEGFQLSGWLYRIAYRTAIDELRSVSRRPAVSLESLPDAELKSIGPSPDEAVTLRLDVLAALNSLKVEHRAAVVLVDELGFDYKTAAEILDVPRGTIASRLAHARGALRRALGEEMRSTRGSRKVE